MSDGVLDRKPRKRSIELALGLDELYKGTTKKLKVSKQGRGRRVKQQRLRRFGCGCGAHTTVACCGVSCRAGTAAACQLHRALAVRAQRFRHAALRVRAAACCRR